MTQRAETQPGRSFPPRGIPAMLRALLATRRKLNLALDHSRSELRGLLQLADRSLEQTVVRRPNHEVPPFADQLNEQRVRISLAVDDVDGARCT